MGIIAFVCLFFFVWHECFGCVGVATGQLQSSVLFQLCHCVPVWMGSYASSQLAKVELIVQSGTRTTKYVAI